MNLLTGLSCFNSKYGKEYSIDLVLKETSKKIFIFTKDVDKIKNKIYWWYHLHKIELNDSIWNNIHVFSSKDKSQIEFEIGTFNGRSSTSLYRLYYDDNSFSFLSVFCNVFNNYSKNQSNYGMNYYNKEIFVEKNIPDLIYIDNDYWNEHYAPYMLNFQEFIYPKKCPIIFHSDIHTHNDCKVATNFVNVLVSNNIMTIHVTKYDNIENNIKLLYEYIRYDNGHKIIGKIIE